MRRRRSAVRPAVCGRRREQWVTMSEALKMFQVGVDIGEIRGRQAYERLREQLADLADAVDADDFERIGAIGEEAARLREAADEDDLADEVERWLRNQDGER